MQFASRASFSIVVPKLLPESLSLPTAPSSAFAESGPVYVLLIRVLRSFSPMRLSVNQSRYVLRNSSLAMMSLCRSFAIGPNCRSFPICDVCPSRSRSPFPHPAVALSGDIRMARRPSAREHPLAALLPDETKSSKMQPQSGERRASGSEARRAGGTVPARRPEATREVLLRVPRSEVIWHETRNAGA